MLMYLYIYIYTYTFYRNNPASFWSQEEVSHKAAAAATLKMLLSYYSVSPGETFRVIMKYEVEKYRMGGEKKKKAKKQGSCSLGIFLNSGNFCRNLSLYTQKLS